MSADLFFAAPTSGEARGVVSTLFLVRREVQLCLFGEIQAEALATVRTDCQRVFAASLTLCAGLDLLAKFYDGTAGDGRRGIGTRFERFLSEVFFAGDADAAHRAHVMYEGYRCGLVHSFSVRTVSQEKSGRIRPDQWLLRLTSEGQDEPLRELAPNLFQLSVPAFYRRFVQAVELYERLVRTDPDARERFDRAYPQFGAIVVGEPSRSHQG